MNPGKVIATDQKLILSSGSDSYYVYDLKSNSLSSFSLSKNRIQVKIIAANNKVFFSDGYELRPDENGIDYPFSTNILDIYDTRTKTMVTKKLSQNKYNCGAAVNGKFVLFAGGIDFKPPFRESPFNTVDLFVLKK